MKLWLFLTGVNVGWFSREHRSFEISDKSEPELCLFDHETSRLCNSSIVLTTAKFLCSDKLFKFSVQLYLAVFMIACSCLSVTETCVWNLEASITTEFNLRKLSKTIFQALEWNLCCQWVSVRKSSSGYSAFSILDEGMYWLELLLKQ